MLTIQLHLLDWKQVCYKYSCIVFLPLFLSYNYSGISPTNTLCNKSMRQCDFTLAKRRTIGKRNAVTVTNYAFLA